ncbi:hypothetical protein K461DRAFT_252443 [Myriangium duriaei CBS 260.36]|uniref:CoA-binding domain-containing protein n=1 Tax=Myriangium duriaei CBS 260.36 TaxID=1168546 RepID=A0A9P4MKM9_9PEZI|nr:hypothetical protein K461DRAFT_252443 [Myriangium duriaei CBS 260.36]
MRSWGCRQGALLRFAGSGHRNARHLSTEARMRSLLIGKDTKVMYQGFTGRVATQNAKDSIAYGTKIVGGVTPGKDGEHLGLPICPSVRAAKDQLKPDATAIFVPMTGAAAAIEEAIEAEIPLIVAVAEHIPIYDMIRIKQMLKGSKSWLVGANSPGIIAPLHSCRIGFQPLPIYKPGHVGVIAKSGTLSYETVGSLSRAGLGQSLCIGCGGDPIAGTTLEEAFRVLVDDPDTHALVVVGEVGGHAETGLARLISEYRANTDQPKPIATLVAGRTAPLEHVMGHAGAFQGPNEPSAEDKYKTLQRSGSTMVDHPEKFGPIVKKLLNVPGGFSQKRAFHTHRQRIGTATTSSRQQQIRSLHLKGAKTTDLLAKAFPDFHLNESASTSSSSIQVIGNLNRTTANPRIEFHLPGSDNQDSNNNVVYLELDGSGEHKQALEEFGSSISRLKIPAVDALVPHLRPAALSLSKFMQSYEVLSAQLSLSLGDKGQPTLGNAVLHFDDAAFKSAKRQESVFALRDKSVEDQTEVEAESHGIVYVTLYPNDPSASIGTLVNGAGLAMNTVDVLALPPHNAKCANFLDTGGKATSDTVKKSFELILSDQRIKVIFVNIFGGLTDCGMIADGIMLAFKEVDMRGVPVVVRLRGTNEEIGQKKIAESGLSLEAFDGFEDAAKRVVELANA